MQLRKYAGIAVLALLLVATVSGVILTRPEPPAPRRAPAARGQQVGPLVVDESSLETIMALFRMPTSPEERESAQTALRLADKAIDLAFAQAVWRMASRPAAATPEARQIDARLQEALKTLAADNATVDRLTASEAFGKSCGQSGHVDAPLSDGPISVHHWHQCQSENSQPDRMARMEQDERHLVLPILSILSVVV